MRLAIRFFAFFDIISIGLLAQPFWEISTHLKEIPDQALSQVRVLLTLPMFLLLFVSATGLMMVRKFGFVTYYVQFPFRLMVWVFSIGFITLLPELLNLGQTWFNGLFKVCFIAEFFRLYFTVKFHKQVF